jgi:hypothetical protein
LTTLSSSDVFITATCQSEPGQVVFKTHTADSFNALALSPVRYRRRADGDVVTVLHKGDDASVGQAHLSCTQPPRGGAAGRYAIDLYPAASATAKDLAALRQQSIRELVMRHSLFIRYDVHVH